MKSTEFVTMGLSAALSAVIPLHAVAAATTALPTLNRNQAMGVQPAGSIVISHRTLSLDTRGFKLAWHPSGKSFAVIDNDLKLIEFDPETGRKIHVLPTVVRGSSDGGIAYSPNGKYLVGGNGVITVYDVATGQKVREILGPYEKDIHGAQGFDALTISPDSKHVAVRYTQYQHTNKGNISVFEIESGRKVFSISDASDNTKASLFSGNLTYTPDGKNLLSARYESPTYSEQKRTGEKSHYSTYLDFLDALTGKRINSITPVHIMRVTAIAVSYDGRYIVTGTNTTSKETARNPATGEWDYINNQDPIRLWDRETGKMVKEFGPLPGAVRALSFNQDGSVLASCQTDLTNKETIWLWNVATGQSIKRMRTPNSAHNFFDCSFSPDGRYLAMPLVEGVELIEIRR